MPAEAAGGGQVSSWAGLRVLVVSPTPTFPVDFGNRRRIYHVCRHLKDQGAEIHFVHYPSESEWREAFPLDFHLAMQRQWDSCHVVPVTRGLHSPPAGEDHTIDEWWDPAIGTMLDWLFRVQHFDVCIVNYTWLSRALEHCPRGVLRVLDTHDRFAGRRQVLEANGIAPEYFHTTEEQEAIAFGRADVVWAIKEEEAELFRRITTRPVLTVRHLEPLRLLPRGRRPATPTRFGILAARNNVNQANIRRCVAALLEHVARRLPPIELVIAGSCCEDLADLGRIGFLRLLGRVEDVADFYRQVDVVLSPIAFSTGLKIKTGEALCHGKAVIALAHAFEGYVPTHRFHQLDTFQALAEACEEVARRPELVAELEEASLRSVVQAEVRQAAAFADTLAVRRELRRGLLVLLDAAAVRPASLVLDHALEAADYLSNLMPVTFHVGGTTLPDADALAALQERGAVVLEPDLAARLEARLPGARRHLAAKRGTLGALAEDGHFAWWFTCCPDLPWRGEGPLPALAFLSLDAMVQGAEEERIIAFAAGAREAFRAVRLLTRRAGPLASRAARGCADTLRPVPFFWRGSASRLLRCPQERQEGRRLLLLADAPDCPLARFVRHLAATLGWEPAALVVPGAAPGEQGAVTAGDYLARHWRAGPRPRLAIDLALDPRLEGLREVLEFAGVAMVAPFLGRAHSGQGVSPQPGGVLTSVTHLADILAEDAAIGALNEARQFGVSRLGDAGWTTVWAEVADTLRKEGRAA